MHDFYLVTGDEKDNYPPERILSKSDEYTYSISWENVEISSVKIVIDLLVSGWSNQHAQYLES